MQTAVSRPVLTRITRDGPCGILHTTINKKAMKAAETASPFVGDLGGLDNAHQGGTSETHPSLRCRRIECDFEILDQHGHAGLKCDRKGVQDEQGGIRFSAFDHPDVVSRQFRLRTKRFLRHRNRFPPLANHATEQNRQCFGHSIPLKRFSKIEFTRPVYQVYLS